MKYIVSIGILLVGLCVGYVVGSYNTKRILTDDSSPTEYITETVYDTVVRKETVKIPVADANGDSLNMSVTDTLDEFSDTLIVETVEDTIREDLSIRREKMIAQKWLNVNVLEEYEEKDSLIKEMMGIQDKMPTRLLVEFWESPLNFSGYKLSRSKLILYDLPAQLEYKLYRRKNKYYLSAQTFYYSLKETEGFLPYLEVSKEVVFND